MPTAGARDAAAAERPSSVASSPRATPRGRGERTEPAKRSARPRRVIRIDSDRRCAGRPGRRSAHHPSLRSGSFRTFPLAVWGRASVTRTYAGAHLVPRSGWRREELRERHRVERLAPARSSRATITSIAAARVGHRVHRHRGERSVTHEHPFDRSGGQVLGVDPHPVTARGPRSRRSRPRPGRRGRRSSTSRSGSVAPKPSSSP